MWEVLSKTGCLQFMYIYILNCGCINALKGFYNSCVNIFTLNLIDFICFSFCVYLISASKVPMETQRKLMSN